MLKKSTSILLAMLLLVSSSHLSFATHYCGGYAQKKAILLDPNDYGCGMGGEVEQHKTDECNIQNKCCDTESIFLDLNENFQRPVSKVEVENQFTLVQIIEILFTFSLPGNNNISYHLYKPPLPDRDIPVLIQSFLI